MSAVTVVTIVATNQTAFLQHRSLSVKLKSADLTLVDPAVVPAVGNAITISDVIGGTDDWTGSLTTVESTSFRGDKTFFKLRAQNSAVLTSLGAAPFNLSDAPNGTTTFGFDDLVITHALVGSTDEGRAKVKVFREGLKAGHTITITSVAEGLSATTFTIMDLTVEWPSKSDAAVYALDLGLGNFATATTGAADGGPLNPIHFNDYVDGRIASGGSAFSAARWEISSGTQTITNALADEQVVFTHPAAFDTSTYTTTNDEFIAPSDGLYIVFAYLSLTAMNAVGYWVIYLSGTFPGGSGTLAPTEKHATINGQSVSATLTSGVLSMTAGDTVELWVRKNESSDTTATIGQASFSIWRIGDAP